MTCLVQVSLVLRPSRQSSKQQQQFTNEDEDVPPLMRVSDDVQESGQESFRKLGDVEEEGDPADGVHDHDLGKHDADDPGGEAVVHDNPVNRWNDLEVLKDVKV